MCSRFPAATRVRSAIRGPLATKVQLATRVNRVQLASMDPLATKVQTAIRVNRAQLARKVQLAIRVNRVQLANKVQLASRGNRAQLASKDSLALRWKRGFKMTWHTPLMLKVERLYPKHFREPRCLHSTGCCLLTRSGLSSKA